LIQRQHHYSLAPAAFQLNAASHQTREEAAAAAAHLVKLQARRFAAMIAAREPIAYERRLSGHGALG
jgi:hypothetical protein